MNIRLLKLALATMALLVGVGSSLAGTTTRTATLNGITYTYTISGSEATITKVAPEPQILLIPETLLSYTVVKIGNGSRIFSECTALRFVKIPDSVTSIGNNAFNGCSGLTTITIPNAVTNIGAQAFFCCSSLASATIPDSVTSIGISAFSDCNSALYDTTSIPGIKLVAGWVVGQQSPLSGELDLNGIRGICGGAFSDCRELTSVTIPDSVASIGASTFSGCSSLAYVDIPDSVTSIGTSAFEGCSSLASVTIPDSVKNIGAFAFAGCSGLTNVAVSNAMISIGASAFASCSGLTSMVIPDSVTSIGASAFANCEGLTSVRISNSVTNIGEKVFKGCTNLTFVAIPDGVMTIGDSAFSGCSGLTSVTIPDSVISIEQSTFSGCNAELYDTTSISGIKLIDGWVVGREATLPNNLYLTGIRGIGVKVFYGCSSLRTVTIQDSIFSIAPYAFAYCSGLTSVIISGGVKNIGDYAFSCCSGFQTMVIPDGTKTIGSHAFDNCDALISVTIPGSVAKIGDYGFANCDEINIVTIGDGVTSIGDYAFAGSGLGGIIIPNSVTNIGNNAFYCCYDVTVVTIPGRFSLGIFPNANIRTANIAEGSTSVLFCAGGNLEVVRVPNSVKDIAAQAFYQSTRLRSVTIGYSVTNIGAQAFAYCTRLKSLSIPGSVMSIGDGAFYNCSSLEELWLPRRLQSQTLKMSIPSGCNVIFYDTVALDINSDHGTASPEVGTYLFKPNSKIVCTTFPSFVDDDPTDGVRYRCIGWTGTGSVPTSGTGTNVSFEIMEDSMLTWLWRKQNLLRLFVTGGSSSFDSHWATEGTTTIATITPSPSTHLYSISLSGDTGGVTLSGATLKIPSDRPREIFATVQDAKATFDVETCFGIAELVGHSEWSWGEEITSSIEEPEPTNGIRYVCTGWAGTGSVPASGTGTNVTFTIEEDSTLTWLWETNVWTECTVSGDAGTTPVAEWRRQNGDALVIPFSIDNAFFGWSLDGDADGVIVDEVGKGISIPADRPRQIEASFVSVETAVGTGGKPLSWNGYSAKWRPTFDTNAPGGSCLRTLATDANASSAVSATVSGSGRLSFDWRISAGRGDTCKFYVDGVEQSGITRSTSWTTVSVNIGSGNHTLEWVYSRGSGSATGEDAAFIDNVDWRPDVTLAVASAFGNPSPTAGTHSLVYGDSVSASVTAPEAVDGTRRVCTGWSGSGSLPANGTGTTVSFVITNDSTLVWNWQTDYLTTLQVAGPVGADFAGEWLNSGTTKVVHWTPTVPYFTIALSGDIQGIILDEASRTLTIPANSPRNITLTVTELTLSSALDISSLVWTTTGAASWFPEVAVSSDSADAVQSGQVIGDDVSGLETTLVGPGTLSWSWRLDSLGNAGVDVILDGEWLPAYEPIGEWAEETLEIGEGEHIVRFEFWNAGTAATIADCAYLDQVSWTPVTSQTVVIGEVEVPTEWLSSEAAAILSANGGNYEAAANATAANGQNTVWECYVAGISPTNETAKFEARIDFVDGSPVVKWSPDLNEDGTKHERVYTVEGRESLTEGSWGPTNAASRFFRVKVSMP